MSLVSPHHHTIPIPRHPWRRRMWTALAIVVAIPVAGGVFVKLDPTDAANFTDSVLRPILGPTAVVSIEKVFFNLSDKAQRLEYRYQQPVNPLVGDTSYTAVTLPSGGLDIRPLTPLAALPKLAGEGVWRDRSLKQFPGKSVAAITIIRSDPARSFAITTVAQFDMSVMQLHSVAGTAQPGGPVGKKGPGVIPSVDVASNNLIAAFDGGFQYRDGAYGMFAGGISYLPLLSHDATLVGYSNGQLKLLEYTGQALGSNIDFVRQNCPMLVENGKNAVTNAANKKLWGRTLSSGMYTWRSGIGLTRSGNLLFAVGNNLTPTTLADALRMAGAVSAMQLDINPNWVRFNYFDPTGPGTYDSTSLTHALKNGAKQYLSGYSKDFFYLTKKS